MHKGNNVSPPLDVLSLCDAALCQQMFGQSGFCQQEVVQSGHRNLNLRHSPAAFNSVAGYTQENGRE